MAQIHWLTIIFLHLHVISLFAQKTPIDVVLDKKERSVKSVDQIVSDYQLIPLILKEDLFISEISKVLVHGDNIYVMDSESNRLFQFDKRGRFLKTIGSLGENLNEYRDISDFDLDSKGNIYIASNRSWAIFKYNSKGEFVKKISTGTSAIKYFALLSDEVMLFTTNQFDDDFRNLLAINQDGKVITKMFPFGKGQMERSFAFTGGLRKSGKHLLYMEPASCKLLLIKRIQGKIYDEVGFRINLGKNMWNCDDPIDVQAFWKYAQKMHEAFSYVRNDVLLTDNHLFLGYYENLKMNNALYRIKDRQIAVLRELTPSLLKYAIHYNPVKGVYGDQFIFGVNEELWFYLKKEAEKIGFLPAIDDTFMKELPKISGDGNDPPYLLFVQFK